jgi:hypothetical protein
VHGRNAPGSGLGPGPSLGENEDSNGNLTRRPQNLPAQPSNEVISSSRIDGLGLDPVDPHRLTAP